MWTEMAVLVGKMPSAKAVHLNDGLLAMNATLREAKLKFVSAFKMDTSCSMISKLPFSQLKELSSIAIHVGNRLATR